MAIYQRGKQWWIEYRYKNVRYREAIGPDEKLAEDVLAQRRVEIRENRFFPGKVKEPEPVKFHEFAKQYVKWSIENKKPSARLRELSIMRSLDREFAEKDLHKITPFDIEVWKVKRKKEVKPGTVNRELVVLKGFFTMAVKWGKCKEHPAREVKLFKGETQRLRYLMPEEVQELILNCTDFLKPIVTVAVHTGMRKMELLSLQRNQVNFEQGTITLTDTKNSQRRDIPMNETVKETLKTIRGEGPFFIASERKKEKPYYWIDTSFHQALEKAEIEDFHFHDLRHTFASNLVMAGEDLNTVGELLGHKDLKMTKRYAHLSPKFKKRAVNVLDEILRAQKAPQEEKMERKVMEFKR